MAKTPELAPRPLTPTPGLATADPDARPADAESVPPTCGSPTPTSRRGSGPSARTFAVLRTLPALLPALALALPPLYWVVEATRRESLTTLGRDQGIFQYVAWAIDQGEVDYRDVRDVNGPLTHLVHRVLLALGGADEYRFHVLDLVITGAAFALVGACLPGLRGRRRPRAVERLGWALAGWVVLSGQYLLYGYWDVAQRESFLDWFLLPGIALQLVAQRPQGSRPTGGANRQALLLAVVGALAVIPLFGKPTYLFFTLTQLAGVVVDDRLSMKRGRAALAFLAGGALGAASQIAHLVACGDIAAFARIQLADVPAMYRFIWPRSAADLLSEPWRATETLFGVAGAVVLVALVGLNEMPRRALVVALVPICAVASILVQGKGFLYHFHPLTAGVHLQWLLFAVWMAERARVAQRRWAIVRLAPLGVSIVFALRIGMAMPDSPYLRAVWLLWGASSPEQRATREYFAHFPEPDFFPFELREAARYLSQHTQPSDRVQVYGMDPYLLFLARRLSATPYIYAYDLNADAALAGGTGGRPDEQQSMRISAIRDAHEADLRARVDANPPAAFVFLDDAPLMSRSSAWDDFERHCPATAAWVRSRYREAARFGHDHIWMRLDLAPPEPANATRSGALEDAPSPDAP